MISEMQQRHFTQYFLRNSFSKAFHEGAVPKNFSKTFHEGAVPKNFSKTFHEGALPKNCHHWNKPFRVLAKRKFDLKQK